MKSPEEIELTPSVVHRGKAPWGRIIAEDYEEAIQELQEAKTQLELDGDNCHVCGDSGHQAWECHHNPLAMARIASAARAYEGNALPWRCFHCGEVFSDIKSAAEHFGNRGDEKPAACGAMLVAFAEMFEQYGVHRNFHNAASVKILFDQTKRKFEQDTKEVVRQIAEQAASIVDACKMVGPSGIGPLFGAGWNEAVKTVSERIRSAYCFADSDVPDHS